MSLIIKNTPLIGGLDVWTASIDSLPSVNYSVLNYSDCDTGRCNCIDDVVVQQISDCFTKDVIDTKILEPYEIQVSILKNKPNFELIPHFDNNDMLGVIIINLINSNTSTKFYDTNDSEIGQSVVDYSKGVMYLNNWDFKHGYKNTSSVNRYIALCVINKNK